MNVGGGSLNQITKVLNKINCKRPFIITDKNMVKLEIITPLLENLKSNKIEFSVYDNTVPEPTSESLKEPVNILQNKNFDCVIAFGGGSPIDSAKAISILAKFGGNIKNFKFPNIIEEGGVPIIAIPTTAGTGSEATKFTIITDEKTSEKMLCVGSGFMPFAAIVDYELTLSVPSRISADTGIDALTHAIEAFVSKKSNYFSNSNAMTAMKMIAPNLRKVYKNGNDREAREKLMTGSLLAGIAFSNASVALVHGMSRPIGALYHVPHGLSNAMLLPTVTEYSLSSAFSKYAVAAKAMDVAGFNDSENIATKKLIKELYSLNIDLEVPSPKKYGIDENSFFDNIEKMADQAIASGSPANNPKVPSKDEIIDLYTKLWH
tara:strand:- start:2366 stop:3496 length:1131 start_codon:yes stop_codon:yes gene_type:complete